MIGKRRREVQVGVEAEKLLLLFGFQQEDLEHLQITRMWIDDVKHCLQVAISSDGLHEVPAATEAPSLGVVTRMDIVTPAEAFYKRYEKEDE